MKKAFTIQNVMTVNPVTVHREDRIVDVIRIIQNSHFDHLPVVDDFEKLVGIISKSDLYQRALNLSKQTSGASYSEKILRTSKASELMTKDPTAVTPDQSVDFAIELLLQGKFHALPVIEKDKLVGIITSKDMLEYIIDSNMVKV